MKESTCKNCGRDLLTYREVNSGFCDICLKEQGRLALERIWEEYDLTPTPIQEYTN